jgi:hypothetical protein
MRGRPGPTRAVERTGIALGAPASYPLVGRGAGDAPFAGYGRDGATRSDPLDQQPPAVEG